MRDESTAGGEDRGSPPDVSSRVQHPSLEDVLTTVFDLNPRDTRVLLAVTNRPGRTVREIADSLDRDRSNVSRSIKRLESAGLVVRRRNVMDDGGIYYEQYPSEPVFEETLIQAVESWQASAKNVLKSHDWGEVSE